MKTVKLGEAKTSENTRVYAIGDTHGYLGLLIGLHNQIKNDLIENPIEKHKIIFLGDYIDRGPDSKGCIDYLINLISEDPNVTCLKGNHEEKLILFLNDPLINSRSFLTYGGAECARSYGVQPVSLSASSTEMISFRDELSAAVPQSHIDFIDQLKIYQIEGDYMCVHAGLRPGTPIDQQIDNDLMTIRSDFIPNNGLYEKVIVHGHTPHYPIEIKPNRMNADTCAYDTGVLTCIVLEDDKYRILNTES